jgi:hypothetical protein
MTDAPPVTAANAGCWLEGSRGWTVTPAVIDIAVSYGFVLDEEAKAALDAYRDDGGMGLPMDSNVPEIVHDVADEAETYLNDNVAPLGYTFGFHDGEFHLQADTWWEEVSA